GVILYCNQSFAELIGRRSEDIVGEPILDFVRERDQLAAMLAEVGPDGLSAELSVILGDGAPAPANLSVADMVVEAGEARLLCLIVTDLRQNYERAREETQQNRR